MQIELQLEPERVLDRLRSWLRQIEAVTEPRESGVPVYGRVQAREFSAARVPIRTTIHGTLFGRVHGSPIGTRLELVREGKGWLTLNIVSGAAALLVTSYFASAIPELQEALYVINAALLGLLARTVGGIVRDWYVLLRELRAQFQDVMAPRPLG